MDLSELDPDAAGGLSGLLGQFALTLGPVFLGMQFGSAAGHLARRAFGQYALPLPWPESSTLLLVPGNVARFAEDWSLPLQEVQLWVCLRELTMHAVLTRPGVRASLMTLLGDASAHAAAAQRSIVERLGDGLGDQASLEEALGDPEALLSDLISPEQRNISATLTAQTTAIGAYVDHITAGIAEKLTSSPSALREAWYRYRIEEGKGEQAFAGLFGLNVGQDEVDRGTCFHHRRARACRRERADPPVVRRARICPPPPRWTRPGCGSPGSGSWTERVPSLPAGTTVPLEPPFAKRRVSPSPVCQPTRAGVRTGPRRRAGTRRPVVVRPRPQEQSRRSSRARCGRRPS